MNGERGDGPKTAAFDHELERLRSGFAERLPARLRGMADEWQDLRERGWNRESARALHRAVHGLIGTAGSLGFSSVAKTARRLERRLAALLEASECPTAEQSDEVSSWFERIGNAVGERKRAGALRGSPGTVSSSSDRVSEKRIQIVVVQEEGSLARELSLQLTHFGFDVQMYSSVGHLRGGIGRSRPVAVILDLGSPGGELVGVDAARDVREAFGFEIPLVFLSNRSDIAARLDAVRAGCSGYFVKPVNYGDVLETLHRIAPPEPEPYRVLIVDDETEAAAFHSLHLRAAGFETVTVTNPFNVTSLLVEYQPDLILMDVYMPGCSGVELAAVIRQEEAFVGIPIVFLSREADRMKQIAALDRGGDDFFTKPVDPDQLVAAIAARARRGRTLRMHMERDGLTGLLSHGSVIEQLEAAVRRVDRQNGRLAVAMVDIDGFKHVNDTYGHLVGDQVLKSLAFLLRQRLRLSDVLGRFGGDEYVVIMPDTDGPAAVEKLEEIRKSFGTIDHDSGKGGFTITLSCGVADYQSAKTGHELVAAADEALYRAKNAGRNRVVSARE